MQVKQGDKIYTTDHFRKWGRKGGIKAKDTVRHKCPICARFVMVGKACKFCERFKLNER